MHDNWCMTTDEDPFAIGPLSQSDDPKINA